MSSGAASIPQHAKNHLPGGSDPLPISVTGFAGVESLGLQYDLVGDVTVIPNYDGVPDAFFYSNQSANWDTYFEEYSDGNGDDGIRIIAPGLYWVSARAYQVGPYIGHTLLPPFVGLMPCESRFGDPFMDGTDPIGWPGAHWRWEGEFDVSGGPGELWLAYEWWLRVLDAESVDVAARFAVVDAAHNWFANIDIGVYRMAE